MAKEKTEFEIRANTLKAMAKQCTAKVKNNRAALMAVFIDRMSENAYASDGYKIAILDMYDQIYPQKSTNWHSMPTCRQLNSLTVLP